MSDTTNKKIIKVPTFAQKVAKGEQPEYLFWVGSAGSFDDRAKKITRAFIKVLEYAKVNYAVLGEEETDTGESAKRAGSEFVFQMQAFQNIELLNSYEVKKIITCDPHDFSILKNEYKEFGGNYEVLHHSQFIQKLIAEGKLKLDKSVFGNQNITYHDPCYLGRGNGEYEAPRFVINQITDNFNELKRNKQRSLCCGAGGSQMFKEAENGKKEIYEERTEDVLKVNPNVVVTACPFCMTMLTDGVKYKEKQDTIKIKDLAELVAESLDL